MRLYRLAADQGNAQGQASLGVFYEQGRGGLTQDDREAARLYRLAADQGNAQGQTRLGVFYEQGRGGLPKDDREAARLFLLARNGAAEAQTTAVPASNAATPGAPNDASPRLAQPPALPHTAQRPDTHTTPRGNIGAADRLNWQELARHHAGAKATDSGIVGFFKKIFH